MMGRLLLLQREPGVTGPAMTGYEPPTALPRELLERADMRAALTAHDFGTVFRLARAEAGISYSKIAAECDIKPDRVGLLARGHGTVATFEKIAQIADALRIPGRLVGLARASGRHRPHRARRLPCTAMAPKRTERTCGAGSSSRPRPGSGSL